MNHPAYRHLRHAGNKGDVIKHDVLVTTLCDISRQAHHPLHYIETHAGRGMYDFHEASRQNWHEWQHGIAPLMNDGPRGNRYLQLVDEAGSHAAEFRYYPGSPWLAASLLAETDTLTLFEQETDEAQLLAQLFEHDERVNVISGDGFEIANHAMPDKGHIVVLVDPPYKENTDIEGVNRLLPGLEPLYGSRCTMLIWYPTREIREQLQHGDAVNICADTSGPGMIALGKYRHLANSSVYTVVK